MKRAFTLLGLFVFLAAAVFAQNTGLNGTVADPSGAVIPNASINLTSVDTGAERNTVSDSKGHYEFDQLTPGRYKITAKFQGFAEVVISNIQLEVNEPATVAVK